MRIYFGWGEGLGDKRKMKKVFVLFVLVIAVGLLAVSIWHRWNTDKQLGRQRLPEIAPIAEFNHGAWIDDLAISPINPDIVASVGQDNVIKVWNRNRTNTPVLTLTDHPSKDICGPDRLDYITFSPTGEWLISKDFWTLAFWEASSGQQIHTFDIPSAAGAVSPDGHLLATASQDVRLWAIRNPQEIKETVVLPPKIGRPPLSLEEAGSVHHRNETVNQKYRLIDFSPDGKWIAAGGDLKDSIGHETVRVWDLQRKQLVKILPRELPKHIQIHLDIRAIHFSPDNRFFACAGQTGYTIWTLPEWHIHRDIRSQTSSEKVVSVDDTEMIVPAGYIQSFTDLAFSPDGKMYAVADFREVTLWALENGDPIALLKNGGLLDSVNVLVFSHDGSILAGGGMAGSVLLWDVSEVRSEIP